MTSTTQDFTCRRILVTDSERGSATAVIRALSRAGYEVFAGSTNKYSAGGLSKHTKQSIVYPRPASDPQSFAEAILNAVSAHHIDLVIPVTDETILPLDHIRASFPPHCRIAISESDSLRLATDKLLTVELANKLGIPTPPGRHVTTLSEAIITAESIGYPVVIKPVSSKEHAQNKITSFRVEYANNENELRHHSATISSPHGVIIQRRVEGVGCGVEILADRGKIQAAFQHERLREVPLTGGTSSMRISRKINPELYQYTERLIKSMNWTGLAMVEFKVGPDGPWLMEINGRIWGSLPLAIEAGMDFPLKLVKLFEQTLPKSLDTDYQHGLRCRNLVLDIKWATLVLIGRQTPWGTQLPRLASLQVLKDLLPFRSRWDTWKLNDPLPGLASIWHLFHRQITKKLRTRPKNG
jgi:predicted ATP-grasp superfamily ATP-dependent carboligase